MSWFKRRGSKRPDTDSGSVSSDFREHERENPERQPETISFVQPFSPPTMFTDDDLSVARRFKTGDDTTASD